MSALTSAPFLDGSSIEAQIFARLDAAGALYKRSGHEIEADIEGTGHCCWKINVSSGLWFCSDGSGRKGSAKTLFGLLGGGVTPAILSAAAAAAAAAGDDAAMAAKKAKNLREAKKRYADTWVCTHETDMPPAWDKGLSTGQKCGARTLRQAERNGVIHYFKERFYYPTEALRQVKMGRGHGARFYVSLKTADGNEAGFQEVILDGDRKTRLFWGQVGGSTHAVKPCGDHRPLFYREDDKNVFLGLGFRYTHRELAELSPEDRARADRIANNLPLKILGEGLETTAAACDALGCAGVACMHATGIIAWAQAFAAEVQRTGRQPGYAAGLLVDRDTSEAGQRACAKAAQILRAVGVRAVLLVPPAPEDGGPQVGEKGSDWGDYPQQGIGLDVLRAHLAAQVLIGDELLASYLAAANTESASTYTPTTLGIGDLSVGPWVRPAAIPGPVAKTVSARVGRRQLRHRIRRYALAVARAKAKGNQEALAPLLVEATVGLGKSTAVKGLLKALEQVGVRTLIVVTSKEEAQTYERAGAFYRHGRSSEEILDWGPWVVPYYCPEDKLETGLALAEKQHGIARHLCHSGHCPHGMVAAKSRAEIEGREPSPAVVNFFRRHPEAEAEPGCTFHEHCEEGREAVVTVMVAQSVGPRDVKNRDLFFVDENVKMVHHEMIDASILANARQAIDATRVSEAFRLAGGKRFAGPWSEKPLDTLDLGEISKAFQAIASGSVDGNLGQIEAGQKKLQEHLGKAETQSWESPQFRDDALDENPLRLARALADYPVEIVNGKLVAIYPTPLWGTLVERKAGMAILDATPHPTTRAVVAHLGGKVERITTQQQVRAIVDPARTHGAVPSGINDYEQRLEQEAQQALDVLKAQRGKLGTDRVFVLMQKPKAIKLLELLYPMEDVEKWDRRRLWSASVDHGIGWWGWHNRAHNRWEGWHPILWDGPALPDRALAEEYAVHRLTLSIAGVSDLPPAWDGSTEVAPVETVVGPHIQSSGRAVHRPTLATVFEFRAAILNAERIQGLGRGRGVNIPIEALILGGGPLQELATTQGIVPEYARVLGPTAAELAQAAHAAAEVRATGTITRMVATGETVTRRGAQKSARRGIGPTEEKGYTQGGSNVGQGSDTLHALIGKLADALAPALAARGRFAERRKLALERAATIPAADRAAVENTLRSLLDQHVECDALLTRMEQWWGDPRTATAAQAQVADIILSDDPPPVEAMAAS